MSKRLGLNAQVIPTRLLTPESGKWILPFRDSPVVSRYSETAWILSLLVHSGLRVQKRRSGNVTDKRCDSAPLERLAAD